ncbi:substrate-binding domain-containing protein [Actinorugispora endophytica]|uniref:Substrate-binding family protein n=1 Tax=Actinorugispora endophytica TaxID=1605990 RepID=A0A4R6UBE4_9ACTN|nr:substrate-binding domain-containing protein [Actinorugispora endophytica]TDQ43891.1 substrate-binding family protein [Actinorugispora endophytica]
MFRKTIVSAVGVLPAGPPTACGGGGTTPGADDRITMGFAQVGAGSGRRTANSRSIQEAAEAAGIDLRFSDARQKQENQIKALRSYSQQDVDVSAFSPVVEADGNTVLPGARRAQIPVIPTDRAVATEDESLYATFLGSDFVEEGRKVGE